MKLLLTPSEDGCVLFRAFGDPFLGRIHAALYAVTTSKRVRMPDRETKKDQKVISTVEVCSHHGVCFKTKEIEGIFIEFFDSILQVVVRRAANLSASPVAPSPPGATPRLFPSPL